MRLPIHMLAIIPQNSSGRSVMTCGPGTMPWMVIAPIISAITALDGMPSVSSGMKDVCAPALFADSGAATPSMAPLPKRDGSFAIFFSSVYAANEPSTAPPPGNMPSNAADAGAAQHRFPGIGEILPRSASGRSIFAMTTSRVARCSRLRDDLREPEQAHCHRRRSRCRRLSSGRPKV